MRTPERGLLARRPRAELASTVAACFSISTSTPACFSRKGLLRAEAQAAVESAVR